MIYTATSSGSPHWKHSFGNVLIPVDASGLGKESVAVVSQVGPVSRESREAHPVQPTDRQPRNDGS